MTNFSEFASSADRQACIAALFGGLVPHEAVSVQLTHSLARPDSGLQTWQVQVGQVGQPGWLRWTLWLELPLSPSQAVQAPVLLSPDACWPHALSSQARHEVLKAGVALASFNRLEIAHDSPDATRSGPVFERWPEGRFGAISAWAWGISRSVDALVQIGWNTGLGTRTIGVVGHSRSGKAALLAAATDERIALTVAHNSGTAGAASFQVQGPQAETLVQLQRRFPHWLGADAGLPAVQQRIEAMDMLPLLAGICPRRLCILQASDDLWANPAGTAHSVGQLRQLYAAQGLSHQISHHERSGGHAMTPLDWQRAAQEILHTVRG